MLYSFCIISFNMCLYHTVILFIYHTFLNNLSYWLFIGATMSVTPAVCIIQQPNCHMITPTNQHPLIKALRPLYTQLENGACLSLPSTERTLGNMLNHFWWRHTPATAVLMCSSPPSCSSYTLSWQSAFTGDLAERSIASTAAATQRVQKLTITGIPDVLDFTY